MAMVGLFTPWKLSNSPIYVSDSHIYNCDTQSYFWKPDQIFQWLAGSLLTDTVDMILWTPTPGQITWSSFPLTLLLFLMFIFLQLRGQLSSQSHNQGIIESFFYFPFTLIFLNLAPRFCWVHLWPVSYGPFFYNPIIHLAFVFACLLNGMFIFH